MSLTSSPATTTSPISIDPITGNRLERPVDILDVTDQSVFELDQAAVQ